MAAAIARNPAEKWATRVTIWALACVVLTGLCYLFVDRPVATWSHDVLHRPAFAVAVTKAASIQVFDIAAIAVSAVALIVRMTGRRLSPAWRTVTAVSLATLLATLLVILMKYGFGRLWPETWTNNNPSWIGTHAYGFSPFHGGRGWESFPSGHTARTTAPFAVLWQRVRFLRPLWCLPTLVIAAALIACNFHFVGDCVAGFFLGVGSAALVMLVI